ncbi:ATP-binding cassette sub- G member 2 [Dissostichus eleginoides]|nr:ATP-binding cassette sub- G member 2 [Dissostichus eleginoides]
MCPISPLTRISHIRFLDVLAARKDPAGLSGEVLIDGAHQPPNFKCLSGYVVQ